MPLVAQRRQRRRWIVPAAVLVVSLVVVYAWLMIGMVGRPKIAWSATAVRSEDELTVTLTGKNTFYWEVGAVTLLDARLDGQPATATAMPLLLGEFAPLRSKSATLRFALPEDDSPSKRTLEIVVTEKNRRGKGPTTHRIVFDPP